MQHKAEATSEMGMLKKLASVEVDMHIASQAVEFWASQGCTGFVLRTEISVMSRPGCYWNVLSPALAGDQMMLGLWLWEPAGCPSVGESPSIVNGVIGDWSLGCPWEVSSSPGSSPVVLHLESHLSFWVASKRQQMAFLCHIRVRTPSLSFGAELVCHWCWLH